MNTRKNLVFKTIVKNEIIQECIHSVENRKMTTKIISGPAKNSTIHLTITEKSGGSQIDVNIDMKLGLKARVLSPIIKKVYKNLLTGILIKIDHNISNMREYEKNN